MTVGPQIQKNLFDLIGNYHDLRQILSIVSCHGDLFASG